MSRTRLDQILVTRGLAESRSKARAAIEAGGVTVDGEAVTSASRMFEASAQVTFIQAHRFVGRAALKLDHALTLWPVGVEGRNVLDIGASTGGFTEVCLERGAAHVWAVDVGQGQIHPRIAADPRVTNLEKTDARDLTTAIIPHAPDLIVCDVSFIGLAKVLPTALDLAGPDADLVTLVKPQFEMDTRADVGKGGLVKDADARQGALDRVSAWLNEQGWPVRESTQSPITGGDGNVEFLLWARRG
jgi:23S rRNA (cytidine1920-2'-O)/16S rRNA (cytidine1409-2'-O)-methyltransferase